MNLDLLLQMDRNPSPSWINFFLSVSQQLLFICLGLKVIACHAVIVCQKSCHMANDPWDMLIDFCFHVYDYFQKPLFIGENGNAWTTAVPMEQYMD